MDESLLRIVYYIEVNVVCVTMLLALLLFFSRNTKGSADSIWYKALICCVVLYCISDTLAVLFRGMQGDQARAVLWVANTLYVTMPVFMLACWGRYTSLRTSAAYQFPEWTKVFNKVLLAIALVTALLSLSTPLTGFAFTLDEHNIYHRQTGIYVVLAVIFVILIYITVRMIVVSKKGESLEARRTARILAWFAVPCIVFPVAQMAAYGSTLAQVGYTFGIFIIHLGSQQAQISRDALTGINNRQEYEKMVDRLIAGPGGNLLIAIADVNKFKAINDTYGHAEGDRALQAVAKVLAQTCGKCRDSCRLALFRYGGDEFIMLSTDYDEGTAEETLRQALKQVQDEWNEQSPAEYDISISLGIAKGPYSSEGDFKALAAEADADMYRVKRLWAKGTG